MFEDREEAAEEEDEIPAPPKKKLMADAMKSAPKPHKDKKRTAVDPRFHTKEKQDFYETFLLNKSPAVNDMRFVDWAYIKANEDYFPHVQDNFKFVDIEDFVGKEMTPWNDELIMQFYSTVHFSGDGSIIWMTDGHRYESTVDEWSTIIGAPKKKESDVDVYSEAKKSHNSMANMYKPILHDYLASHKMGLVYFLQAGIPTANTIMRYTLMPKSESAPRTTTQFSTKPRSAALPAPETRQTSSAQASAPSAPPPTSTQAPPISTPPAPGQSAEDFTDALLSTSSSAAQRDE
ncbi:hypothetical protein ZWY2020_001558 [Hordeum vulgare]|nr:hypothetical protein ZWY2020_001558 [Hordeum vulgare]